MPQSEADKVARDLDNKAFQRQMGQIGQGDFTHPDNILGRQQADTKSMYAYERNKPTKQQRELMTGGESPRRDFIKLVALVVFALVAYSVYQLHPHQIWYVSGLEAAIAAAVCAVAAWVVTSWYFWGLIVFGALLYSVFMHH